MSMSITVGDDRDDDTGIDGLDESADRDDEEDSGDDADRSSRGRRGAQDERDDDSNDDEEPEGGWKAEAARLRRALAKSNATGLRRRNQLRELRNAESKANDEDDSDEEEKPEQKSATLDARTLQRRIDKAKKEGRKEAEAEYKRDLLFTKAESRLERAGVSERNVRLLKAEIDLEDFAEEPDEEIDRLRSEFPDLFKSSRSRKRRINGGDDRDSSRKKGPMTASQRQAAQLRGSGS